jgi:hypothetical protein
MVHMVRGLEISYAPHADGLWENYRLHGNICVYKVLILVVD